jgi:hypothetical protein
VKRLCLFLRWMARPDDGIDLGVWKGLPPSALVIPLDTHVLRISRAIGLTERRSASFRTALDVTASLRRLDPEDPVRYDFAIAQLGITRGCRHRHVPELCTPCPLRAGCGNTETGQSVPTLGPRFPARGKAPAECGTNRPVSVVSTSTASSGGR